MNYSFKILFDQEGNHSTLVENLKLPCLLLLLVPNLLHVRIY